MTTRRRFLQLSAAAAVGAGLYTWRIEPEWLEVVERPLPLRELPRGVIGWRLVQLSDLHIGWRVSDDYLRATFRRVRELAAEVVVYTGDFISYHDEIFPQVTALIGDLPLGRQATLATFGNHDYGRQWSMPQVADRLWGMLRERGVQVLRNEVAEVGGLRVAGMDDLWARTFDPRSVWRQVEPAQVHLALSHNPDTVDRPVWEGFAGWVLAGHTHGGQCKPPFLPPPLLPVTNRRYTAGEFALDGGRSLYVSRGVGHLTRVRFNVRPEVTVFTLTAAT